MIMLMVLTVDENSHVSWKIMDFLDPQILREINYCKIRVSKNATFSEVLNVEFVEFQPRKMAKSHQIQNSQTDFGGTLISRKNPG